MCRAATSAFFVYQFLSWFLSFFLPLSFDEALLKIHLSNYVS